MTYHETGFTHETSDPQTDEKIAGAEQWINDSFRAPSAFDEQIGGDHYKRLRTQPVCFIMNNRLNFIQGSIVKYAVRKKGGRQGRMEDYRKIIHYAEMALEMLAGGEDV